MRIVFKKSFTKRYQKLKQGEKNRINATLKVFSQNPFEPILYNHPLQKGGKIKNDNLRAIAAGGDLRLIFQEFEDYIEVVFIDVGSHNQVY